MPSTQQQKISFQRACSDLYGAGGEPPGEPPAPPLRSAEAARPLSEEVVDGALAQARLRRSVAGMTDDARETLIDALLDQLGAERDGLPDELRERLLDGMIDELIAGKRGEREILGQDGVLGEVTRRMVQRALEEELTEHLGYPAGQAPPGGTGNSRNGGTPKTLLTDQGAVRIDTPRDRKSRFEPQLVKKGQRRLAGLDEKIIALYAGGMTTREIETYITELYGPGVSRETVSRVTAAVLEDAKAWQTRPLEQIYPILYLDALVIKIRDGQAIRNFSCYLAIGVNLEGDRDVLGMWFQRTEGAKFWLQVLTDLKTRGVQDVLVCCVDGLTGFPEAIEAVYPQAWVQTCLVHLVRSSLRFVPYKNKRKVAATSRSATPTTARRSTCSATMMGHRTIDTTRGYYKVNKTRMRKAVARVSEMQLNHRGNRVTTSLAELVDAEYDRYQVGQIAVAFGTCHEPSNVKSSGQSCPYRFRCFGCAHFRTDPSYLPELREHLQRLLVDHERLNAATDGMLEDWARRDALPAPEEIVAVRRLIRNAEAILDGLTAEERAIGR